MSSHKNAHFCLVQCILQSLALIRALVLSLVGALANARAPTRLSTRARIQCKDCKMHDTQHAVRVFIVTSFILFLYSIRMDRGLRGTILYKKRTTLEGYPSNSRLKVGRFGVPMPLLSLSRPFKGA